MIVKKFRNLKKIEELHVLVVEADISFENEFLSKITHVTMVDEFCKDLEKPAYLSQFDIIFLFDDIYDGGDVFRCDEVLKLIRKNTKEFVVICLTNSKRYSRKDIFNVDVLRHTYGKVTNEYLAYLFQEFAFNEPQTLQQMLTFLEGMLKVLQSLQVTKNLPMNGDFEALLSTMFGKVDLATFVPERIKLFQDKWEDYENSATSFNFFKAINVTL